MSTEPERDIEKTLKAYAKKRREEAGAPLEMHPATRRLLQGEVTRRRTRNQGVESLNELNGLNRLNERGQGLLERVWPAVAWGLAVFAGLAMAAALMLPRARKGE